MKEALLKIALSDIIKLTISIASLTIISRSFGLSSYGEFAFFISSASLVSVLPSQFPSFKATTELINENKVQSLFVSALSVKMLVFILVIVLGGFLKLFAVSAALLFFTLSFVISEYIEAWLLYEKKLSTILHGNILFGTFWLSFLGLTLIGEIGVGLVEGYAMAIASKAIFFVLRNKTKFKLLAPNLALLKTTLDKSIYYGVIRVVNQLNEQLPVIWLMSFAGASTTGIFAIAQKVIVPFHVGIASSFKVIFNDGLSGTKIRKRQYLLVGLVLVISAKILGYFAFIPLTLLSANSDEAVLVLSLLAFDLPLVFLSSFYSNELLLTKSKNHLFYLTIIQSVIFLPIIYHFIGANFVEFVEIRFLLLILFSCAQIVHISIHFRAPGLLHFLSIPFLTFMLRFL